jgi:hypothetical protein
MTADNKDAKVHREPTPKDAQKGGQGAVGKEDKGVELDQRGHPGEDSEKSDRARTAAIFVEQINWAPVISKLTAANRFCERSSGGLGPWLFRCRPFHLLCETAAQERKYGRFFRLQVLDVAA